MPPVLPQKRSQVQQRRADPESRWVDATAPWAKLVNRRKDRDYVFVYKNSVEQGPEYYRLRGYDFVRRGGDDDVQPMITRTGGESSDLWEIQGHVLMSIDKKLLEEMRANGDAGGGLGTAYYDEIEQRIVSQRGGQDTLRGLHGRFGIRAKNETSALEEDTE